MGNGWSFDIRTIHKVNYITIIVICLFMSLTTISMLNFKLNVDDLLPFITIIIVSVIIYFSNVKDIIKATAFSLAIILSNFGYLLFANFNEQTTASDTLVFGAGIICGALYFNKKILVVDAFVLDICILILFLVNPTSILGEYYSYSNMLNFFVILNAIIIIIYYITALGENLIKIVNKKSLKNKVIVDNLDMIMLNINNLMNDLESNMETFSGDSDGDNGSSKDKRESVDQTNIGVQEIVKRISDIKTEIEGSGNTIEEQTLYTKEFNETINKVRKLT
ncbi:hypothetical protein FDA33_04115 [Clostridium botulinum]|uniref:Methyl-accepting chemotaxis protein n=2 Tax=Clostridium botulinum TaxID=1491 RepID=A0A6B4SDL8_CLOBO|nr:hypothetical protein [Clostridium botulinum]EES48486.1 putative membrane protein [Clostridium botulinum E1 str. 'BoNT E Beluga']KIL09636.1 membrane protein [Clostridium botulinum]MBN1058226.1 hypothetical protein [Clostridium botulinum]MBN1061522.1 hypothetical protein [Clostridium botulinum]MBN1064595.1 hypothetical protein [Clostridium botulinum]